MLQSADKKVGQMVSLFSPEHHTGRGQRVKKHESLGTFQ